MGALVNLSAIVAELRDSQQIHILCAGTNGHVTREDILAAGAIVSKLGEVVPNRYSLSENAERARGEWEELTVAAKLSGSSLSTYVAEELRNTPGGKNLLSIGQDLDLQVCAQIDQLDLVPELDPSTWRIRPA